MLGSWQGLDAVFKVRKPFSYRLRVLDDAIRRTRTVREAEMMHAARGAGVPAPHIYDLDPSEATLVMEYIRGDRLRDVLGGYSGPRIKDAFREFGKMAASLHAAGISHGDLTTANVIVGPRGMTLIDFGLSFRTSRLEDQAVDLRLIKETVTGAHPSQSRVALGSLFEGYSEVLGGSKLMSVQRQLGSIERRGRYARVT